MLQCQHINLQQALLYHYPVTSELLSPSFCQRSRLPCGCFSAQHHLCAEECKAPAIKALMSAHPAPSVRQVPSEEETCLAVWIPDMCGFCWRPGHAIVIRSATVHKAHRSPEDLEPGHLANAGHGPLYQPGGLGSLSQAHIVNCPGPSLSSSTRSQHTAQTLHNLLDRAVMPCTTMGSIQTACSRASTSM